MAYVLLALTEERRVAAEFGAEYRDYQRRVAMFIPGRGGWRPLVNRSRARDDASGIRDNERP